MAEVWYDRGAGVAVVTQNGCYPPGPHFSFLKEFDTRKEAEEYLREWHEETTVYAVFWNRAAAEGYVAKESDITGNWRGSKHGYYNCVGEFSNAEEAYDCLEAMYSGE